MRKWIAEKYEACLMSVRKQMTLFVRFIKAELPHCDVALHVVAFEL
jgi:hypothetical protein